MKTGVYEVKRAEKNEEAFRWGRKMTPEKGIIGKRKNFGGAIKGERILEAKKS